VTPPRANPADPQGVRSNGEPQRHDFDWIVIGSGFGGSVAALRLAEKGYSVCVLECGRRFTDDEFAKSTWNLRRYFWLPRLGLRGVLRLTFFKDVFVASGSGVGGGSLGYANTLYRARPAFFRDPQWSELADWEPELEPHYDVAERMLGVTDYEGIGPADALLREYGEEIGVGDTFANTRVGVFFGQPGEEVPDPYFGGEGPARTGCLRCGSCMVGCRHGAKNTLVKNYLWFAERLGVRVVPERQVTELRPLGAADGSGGYAVSSIRSGAWLRRRRQVLTAKGVVVAAGALGTNRLLADCKRSRALPRISDRLGHVVRTNSESVQAVTARNDDHDFAKSVAITSSIYPDPDTHIEVVTYGHGGDAMSRLFTTMTGNGTRLTRPLHWVAAMLRHPLRTVRLLWPRKWSRRTVILLVMQTTDTAMRLVPKRRLLGRGVRLQTEQDPERPNPTWLPAAEKATQWFADRIGGIPQSGLTESALNIPTTAHILGGAVIAPDRERGVVDADNRVYGYENLIVSDGAAIPANPGVNPSLTITAVAEHAMAAVPPKPGADLRDLPQAARPANTTPAAGPAG
jgi:cholesterol oxidase